MTRRTLVFAAALAAIAMSVFAAQHVGEPLRDPWTPQEIAVIASMRITQAGERPTDPSNRHETRREAAELGKALFNDVRLSRNGQVSCASCHVANAQFEDGRQFGKGVGTGSRRTMPVMGAAHAPFLFWDGRKDSAWSQALGPFEDPAEHGSNRVQLAKLVLKHYRGAYEAMFGLAPDLGKIHEAASPNGSDDERAAWAKLPVGSRDDVNRVFSNMGKAIAAYERNVSYSASRFDDYAEAVVHASAGAQAVLTAQEVKGLRIFLGKGQCVTCHNGPLFSDHGFHNTGVPPWPNASADAGRLQGIRKLLNDEFNCLGPYSDARQDQCRELQFLSTSDAALLGAFRTPSLRNVAARPPYMHAGQLADLEQVLKHYASSPAAAVGSSELARPGDGHRHRQAIRLSDADIQDVVAFLGTLTGPVIQPK
ncbi:MAG: cytochrome c peroxidase [Pseudomonadota bacterium]